MQLKVVKLLIEAPMVIAAICGLLTVFGARLLAGLWHHPATIAGMVVFAVVVEIAWIFKASLRQAESTLALSYGQNVKIRTAIEKAMHIFEDCSHDYEPDHSQCLAAFKHEMQSIKAALGRSPEPDIIKGNKPELQHQ